MARVRHGRRCHNRQCIFIWLVAKDGNETGLLVTAYVIYRGVRSRKSRPDR